MKLSNKDHDLTFLNSEFENLKFEFFVSDDPYRYLSCFACWCSSAEEIVSNWRAIQNLISVHYQPNGNLARWNIYLAFFCTESIPILDKYVIQNDKYAVRKVILDDQKEIIDIEEANSLLSSQLLGTDLKLKKHEAYSEHEIFLNIAEYVKGAPLDSTNESRNIRAEMINKIIEFLSANENQKG